MQNIPSFTPARLKRLPAAFDHKEFIFELKHHGFRALAHVAPDECRLVSRRGIAYKPLRDLRDSMRQLGCRAVLDGEIVSLDEAARPRFYDLLRHRGSPVFYAFDILWLDGRDLRDQPLLERKRILERVAAGHPRVLVAQHVEGQGTGLFRAVCETTSRESWRSGKTAATGKTGSKF